MPISDREFNGPKPPPLEAIDSQTKVALQDIQKTLVAKDDSIRGDWRYIPIHIIDIIWEKMHMRNFDSQKNELIIVQSIINKESSFRHPEIPDHIYKIPSPSSIHQESCFLEWDENSLQKESYASQKLRYIYLSVDSSRDHKSSSAIWKIRSQMKGTIRYTPEG